MVYDGNVHLTMNGMRSVGSVTGNGTAVNELSHSSPATFMHVNLIHKLRRRVSHLYFVCYLEDGASLQTEFEDFMQINRPGHKLRKVCNPDYEVVVSLGNKRA